MEKKINLIVEEEKKMNIIDISIKIFNVITELIETVYDVVKILSYPIIFFVALKILGINQEYMYLIAFVALIGGLFKLFNFKK